MRRARFRPNIVIEGVAPHAEDAMALFHLGPVVLRGVKLCSRCSVTTTDQRSGARDPHQEPLRALGKYRHDHVLRGVTFGQNCTLHEGIGKRLAVGATELIIINGAGYEQFLNALLESAGGEATIVEASSGTPPREEAGSVDPHMWLDPNNMSVYVENIRDALVRFDPEGKPVYQSNADAYVTQLKTLDSWIQEQAGQLPRDQRLLVTNHEALGYFAGRYGFTVVGTVIESFSSDASPSAQQMAALIDQVRSSGAPAIFLDAGDNEALARQIAAETGAKVVTDLHIELIFPWDRFTLITLLGTSLLIAGLAALITRTQMQSAILLGALIGFSASVQ